MGALIITNTILGVPHLNYSIVYLKFRLQEFSVCVLRSSGAVCAETARSVGATCYTLGNFKRFTSRQMSSIPALAVTARPMLRQGPIYVFEYLVINSDIPQNPYLIIQARVLSPGPRNVELHPLGPNTNPEKAKKQQSIASYSTK